MWFDGCFSIYFGRENSKYLLTYLLCQFELVLSSILFLCLNPQSGQKMSDDVTLGNVSPRLGSNLSLPISYVILWVSSTGNFLGTPWGKCQLFIQKLPIIWCGFWEKWDFENVNYVKNETLKLWILWKVRFSKWPRIDHAKMMNFENSFSREKKNHNWILI